MTPPPNHDDFAKEVGKQAEPPPRGTRPKRLAGTGPGRHHRLDDRVAGSGGRVSGPVGGWSVRDRSLLDLDAAHRRAGHWLHCRLAVDQPGVAGMNWAAALASGFGLGLLYFGDIWRTVRRLQESSPTGVLLGRLARLGLTGVVFYGLLSTGGITALLAGLAGVMLARCYLVRIIRSQESGVRSQESGVRSQETGDRRQESGVRSQESGVRSQESEMNRL